MEHDWKYADGISVCFYAYDFDKDGGAGRSWVFYNR